MQKLGGVVILMSRDNQCITYLLGDENIDVKPLPIFSATVVGFLDDLSKELRNNSDAKRFPDIVTFAFWCRNANIQKLKEEYHLDNCKRVRMGRGMAFHIAPSNVPINFAFTLVFGMLSGNANVVRASSKDFEQTRIVCKAMSKVLGKDEYDILRRQNAVVMYDRNKEINDMYSEMCDVRVIWGGDNTISEIRKSPIKSRCTEITFADRYSFALFNEETFEKMDDTELSRIAQGFYNDTYLMDQNACSSPHMIVWKKSKSEIGRKLFYKSLEKVCSKYNLEDKKTLDKFTRLYEMIAADENIVDVKSYTNVLYIAKIDKLESDMSVYRGIFGLFFETDIEDFTEVIGCINNKVQTCVAYGIDEKLLVNQLLDKHCTGIDRIVKPGDAMEIGTFWDGYDVVRSMSREIYLV